MRKLCIKTLFFITVLCLMPISKKAPFSALETLDDDFFFFFLSLVQKLRENYWEASSRMQIRIIFFAALIVDPFVFFPKEDQYLKEKEQNQKKTGGNFFHFTLTWRIFFTFHFLTAEGWFFFVLHLHGRIFFSCAWMSLKKFVFYRE